MAESISPAREKQLMAARLGSLLLMVCWPGLVGAAPPVERPRLDRYGDPLPPGAIARLGTVRLRHAGYVECAVFSRDGKTLTSSGSDDWIRVWEVATGRQVRACRRQGPRLPVLSSAALSRDGTLLALASWSPAGSGDICNILLHDATTGKLLWELPLHGGGANTKTIVFSPDGRLLAAGDNRGKVHLWETLTGKRRLVLEWEKVGVTGLTFSTDGRLLASGNGVDGVLLFNVATGKQVRLLQSKVGKVEKETKFKGTLTFSPDGCLLATVDGDAIRLWSLQTGKMRLRIPCPFQGGILFSPDSGTLIFDDQDGTVVLFETTTGKKIRTIQAHQWQVGPFSGNSRRSSQVFAHASVTPDGRVLATWGSEAALRFWDMATGRERVPSDTHRRGVHSVAFAPDTRTLASAGEDEQIRFWALATNTTYRTCAVRHASGRELAFSPDGKLLACGAYFDWVRLWDVRTGKEVRELSWGSLDLPQASIAFTPDGSRLATVCTGRVHVWSMKTGSRGFSLKKHKRDYGAVSFNAKRLAATSSTHIHVWDIDNQKPFPLADNERHWLSSPALSPDDRNLAASSQEDDILLWELATGRLRGQFKGRSCVRFSPNGRILATATEEGAVLLWDIGTGKELLRLPGHRGPIHSVAFSADGTRLASGSEDTTVLVWDLTGLLRRDHKSEPELTQEALGKLWEDLKADDARRAYRAINGLVTHPRQAIDLLRAHARPAALNRERVRQLLEALDSPRFATRVKAEAGLLDLGGLVEPELRKVLRGQPSLEMRRRVERILERLREPFPAREDRRSIRLVEVLERIGSTAARKVLVDLAGGSPLSRLTQEAKTALKRLGKP
jgi:WD40 repeat protein